MSPVALLAAPRTLRHAWPQRLLACSSLVLFSAVACQRSSTTSPANPASTAVQDDASQRDVWAQPDKVVQSLGLSRQDLIVADIGAGSGYFSRWLAKAVPQGKVYAVEVDGNLRRHIESHRDAWGTPNIEAKLAINEHPLLPQASVDWVFMSNTYAYLPNRVNYLREVAKALRPGGRLTIVDFRPNAQCQAIAAACPAATERVDPNAAVAEAQSAGFKLVSQADFLPYQYVLTFERAA